MKHAHDSLTTERLTLRRFTLDDLEPLDRLNSDARVMRYLGGPIDRVQSGAMLKGRILKYYEEPARHPGRVHSILYRLRWAGA